MTSRHFNQESLHQHLPFIALAEEDLSAVVSTKEDHLLRINKKSSLNKSEV
ncbi:MAG: hypothetical protein ACW99F_18915 [Candidatus Hodarchaeales archaeon]